VLNKTANSKGSGGSKLVIKNKNFFLPEKSVLKSVIFHQELVYFIQELVWMSKMVFLLSNETQNSEQS